MAGVVAPSLHKVFNLSRFSAGFEGPRMNRNHRWDRRWTTLTLEAEGVERQEAEQREPSQRAGREASLRETAPREALQHAARETQHREALQRAAREASQREAPRRDESQRATQQAKQRETRLRSDGKSEHSGSGDADGKFVYESKEEGENDGAVQPSASQEQGPCMNNGEQIRMSSRAPSAAPEPPPPRPSVAPQTTAPAIPALLANGRKRSHAEAADMENEESDPKRRHLGQILGTATGGPTTSFFSTTSSSTPFSTRHLDVPGSQPLVSAIDLKAGAGQESFNRTWSISTTRPLTGTEQVSETATGRPMQSSRPFPTGTPSSSRRLEVTGSQPLAPAINLSAGPAGPSLLSTIAQPLSANETAGAADSEYEEKISAATRWNVQGDVGTGVGAVQSSRFLPRLPQVKVAPRPQSRFLAQIREANEGNGSSQSLSSVAGLPGFKTAPRPQPQALSPIREESKKVEEREILEKEVDHRFLRPSAAQQVPSAPWMVPSQHEMPKPQILQEVDFRFIRPRNAREMLLVRDALLSSRLDFHWQIGFEAPETPQGESYAEQHRMLQNMIESRWLLSNPPPRLKWLDTWTGGFDNWHGLKAHSRDMHALLL
ncbi:hypothetical protein MMC07_008979 [Pseudocyphellaria aurata]|nr:hypothetical protein [Pseudocyphellaria aurata]